MQLSVKGLRPKLRGYLHQEAFFISLGACILLVAKSTESASRIAALIYSLGLLLLFGVSAFYHRNHWNPRAKDIIERIDHSAIFILIASTFTPICMLALSPTPGHQLLDIIWFAAVVGILQSVFWPRISKVLRAGFYVVMGWLAIPYMGEFKEALGVTGLWLIISGGIAYTVGAVFYAAKRPNIIPMVFGHHELFHLFTVVGATLHFIVIYRLVT